MNKYFVDKRRFEIAKANKPMDGFIQRLKKHIHAKKTVIISLETVPQISKATGKWGLDQFT